MTKTTAAPDEPRRPTPDGASPPETRPLFPDQPEEEPDPPPPPRRDGLSQAEQEEVQRLHQQGLGTRKIARTLGRSRHAVRRVLLRKGALESSGAASKTSKLDPFREQIKEKVQQGLTATRIFRELQAEGYRGGRTILTDYARSLRAPLAPRSRRVTRRFETEPGEECQVDWSTYRVPLGGVLRTIHALAVILACSRFAFLRFYPSQRQALLLEGLEAALHAFCGCTRKMVFDNMATVVLGRVGRDRRPLWNPELLAFADHYGFEPRLCRVADPNRKGEVEAFLGYAERDFVRGREAESFPDLNLQAERWLTKIANRRRHGTTGRVPEEAWAEERPFLIELPAGGYPGACQLEHRRVAEDCTVSVQGTRYTVPSRLAHKQLRVRLYAERFEVLDKDGSVAMERPYAVGKEARRLQLDPAHYKDLPRARPHQGGKTRRMKEEVLARWPALEAFVDGIHVRVKSLLHVHLRKILRLAERYGDEALEAAALKAHVAGRHNANALERILEQEAAPTQEEPLPLAGAAARAEALLGDLEEATLDSYAYLDRVAPQEENEEEEDNGAP